MKIKTNKSNHINWLVWSRNENQIVSLRLFELLERYKAACKTGKNSLAAQALVGVSFSLWRAAFLADKKTGQGVSLKAATSFLNHLILHNSIGYAQDSKEQDWTFNYYLNNARYTLRNIKNILPDILPNLKDGNGASQARWECAHKNLVLTIDNFESHLEKDS